ncbi:xylose isomerase [Lacibacter luteus]|uniref:Xylose isomerase n=1 Tax=Lacibacter luteus TaxID=2508719 RepID=A0A4Q1CIL4_9BACT|nr:TIM barrel protein [Lacibacter luteus]RXK60451.1 xylose isomerase [Lacibacter luteus]
MQRRQFLQQSVLAGAAAVTGTAAMAGTNTTKTSAEPVFKMNYAIHDNMFRNHAGNDFIDQIKFAHGQGFRAIEDNGMRGRDKAYQEKIGATLKELGMTMGVFVAHDIDWQKPSLTTNDKAIREKFLTQIKESVDVAKRCGAKWMVVVPGLISHNMHIAYQKANVLESLRRAADILAKENLTLLLEPLNFRDHPSQVLPDIPNIYEMVKSVNSPGCKMLFDVYHVQIHSGNLIPNIDLSWDETVYVQLGDNPGRKEPTTGEINYKNIFKHLTGKGYKGLLGMEHGNSQPGKEGEVALIKAYREVDSF